MKKTSFLKSLSLGSISIIRFLFHLMLFSEDIALTDYIKGDLNRTRSPSAILFSNLIFISLILNALGIFFSLVNIAEVFFPSIKAHTYKSMIPLIISTYFTQICLAASGSSEREEIISSPGNHSLRYYVDDHFPTLEFITIALLILSLIYIYVQYLKDLDLQALVNKFGLKEMVAHVLNLVLNTFLLSSLCLELIFYSNRPLSDIFGKKSPSFLFSLLGDLFNVNLARNVLDFVIFSLFVYAYLNMHGFFREFQFEVRENKFFKILRFFICIRLCINVLVFNMFLINRDRKLQIFSMLLPRVCLVLAIDLLSLLWLLTILKGHLVRRYSRKIFFICFPIFKRKKKLESPEQKPMESKNEASLKEKDD